MVSFPARSYSCGTIQSHGQPPRFSREFKTIHDDFKEVEAKIDETRQSIERQQPRQVIEEKLDKLDLQLHKVHPEVTEITEETDKLSPRDKTFLAFESKVLTDKLNNLTHKLPDQKLRGKAAHLTEAQKNFQALMNFEFKNGPSRNPEKNDENGFDRQFRRQANEQLRLMAAEKFQKSLLKLNIKPATGLAY